jgi:dolichol-phosphate mannosyltransferase
MPAARKRIVARRATDSMRLSCRSCILGSTDAYQAVELVSGTNPTIIARLRSRENFRERYWERNDPILNDRLLWRAQTFRHLVHLLPGQSVLELGCGRGRFTKQLVRVSRGGNPIVAVTFSAPKRPTNLPECAQHVVSTNFPDELDGRRFDCVVAMDLLDRELAPWLLDTVYHLLSPSGQVVFYESNPWNVLLKGRRALGRLLGRNDPRALLSRPELYELLSEIGYIRAFAVFNDFVFAPLTESMIWLLRNLSILLENAPGVRTLAGSILLHAQKPPKTADRPIPLLCEHQSLEAAISVVVPCYNEEANIEPLVTSLRALFGDYLHEIILVDDNSSDSTAHVIRELADRDRRIKPIFRTAPNGVGRAITAGYKAASGEWILSMDCDFRHLLPEVRDLFDAAAEGFDVVVGSRFTRHSVLLNYPFQKIVANRGFHLLARVILRRKFRDLTNNLKIIRREVTEHLILNQPHFAVNAETGLQPLIMGCRVREVPISWINRTPDMGTSSFRLLRVGGGYGQVLYHLLLGTVFKRGPYRDLPLLGSHRHTYREDPSLTLCRPRRSTT